MNQTRQEEEEHGRAGPAIDHFIVSCRSAGFFVSKEMAAHIEACLDARRPSKWIVFVDVNGSRVRLRRREIEYVLQSTSEQRAADRAYGRAIRQEQKAERDWSDED
jgi:hypothetical protein